MKPSNLIVALVVLLFPFAARAMEAKTTAMPFPSPEAIVQAQLDAYNRHDLEGFLSFYSDDAVLVNYPYRITQSGKAQMRTGMRGDSPSPTSAQRLSSASSSPISSSITSALLQRRPPT